MKRLKKILTKATLFDLVLISVFIAGIVYFATVFFRKADYIDVTVKVNETVVTYSPWSTETGTGEWFGRQFYPGMSEKDSLGKVQAEVLDVRSYDTRPSRQAVYLKLKLLGMYTKATSLYSYNGKPLLIGSTIKLQLDNVNVEGLVTDIAGINDNREKQKIFIAAIIKDDGTLYYETNGIDAYVADAIKVGEQIKDSNGEVVITIKSKVISDAERLVVAGDGRTLVRNNPLKKKVSLVLEVFAYKINDKYYLFDDVPLLIGEIIPINTDKVSVFPRITNIRTDEK